MSQLGIEMTTPGQQQKKSRLGSIIAVILAFVVVGALLGGVLVLALNLINTSSPDEYPGPGTGAVEVRIVTGQTSQQIGATLQANGVIRDGGSFAALGDDRLQKIQPGTYRMKKRMTSAGALDLLLDPTAKISAKVVIPEGSSLKKTLAILSSDRQDRQRGPGRCCR